MNGLALAYIGDAYYELEIRKHLINKGFTNVNILHNKAVKFTSGNAQATIVDYLINNNLITEDEFAIFKRGRNQSSSGRKNIDPKIYTYATGFESLIGYLYLNDKERLNEIVLKSIYIIENGVV